MKRKKEEESQRKDERKKEELIGEAARVKLGKGGRCFCEKAESFGVRVKGKERESLLAFTCRIPDCERAMAAGRVIGEQTEKSMRVTSTFGSPERTSRGIFMSSDILFLNFSLSFLFLSSFCHKKNLYLFFVETLLPLIVTIDKSRIMIT